MAVATGVTLSASLTGIVDDIRVRAHKFMAHKGVMKALVTPVGVGQKGKSVTEPYWDPTSRTGTGATEGQLFTQFSSYVPTTRSYTETEWAEGTILTYDDVEDGKESVRDEHARMHGLVHAKKIEQKLTAVFASFTTNTITATASTGLTYAKVRAAVTKVKSQSQAFDGPFNLVVNDNVYSYTQANLTQNSNYGPLGSLGNKLLDAYYAGNIGNDVRVFYSNLGIPVPTTATLQKATVCGLFTKDAIGLFMPRDFLLKVDENIKLRGYELVSTHRAGARVRLEKAGVKITAYGVSPS